MNKAELKVAVLSDCHREDYTPYIDRFITQAEGFIRSILESYELKYALTDAERLSQTEGVYLFPARVTLLKQVFHNGMPLERVDETAAYENKNCGVVQMYATRSMELVIAGTPAPATTIDILYMGMPPPLVLDADTNTLLNDYPQLYIDATSVFVFRRAQDYDSAQAAFTSVNGLMWEINRKTHKQLAGARASNAYNTSFRSSY